MKQNTYFTRGETRSPITSALANAIRGMPDPYLAELARALDDKSLVTLAYNMRRVLEPVYGKELGQNKAISKAQECAPNGTTAIVYECIRSEPGQGSRSLRNRLPGVTATGLRKALRRLVSSGRVRRDGCTSDSRYYLALQLVENA